VFPILGTTPINAVSRKDCRQLITAIREKVAAKRGRQDAKALSIVTVRSIARTLSAVLSQAVEDEHLSADPALRLGKYLRRGDQPKHQIDPFTRADVAPVLAVAREQFSEWYPWLLTAFRTGLRLGELLALQWGDIDRDGGYIRFNGISLAAS
jgi:integrase